MSSNNASLFGQDYIKRWNRMSNDDYKKYLSAIKQANDDVDKDALRRIQKQLIANYGLNNEDVLKLLKKFKYTV